MADPILIVATEVALVGMVATFLLLRQVVALRPRILGSVGWHGGNKKKR